MSRYDDKTRAARARWAKKRRREIAYGRWEPYVDPTRTRQHVQHLMDTYGLSLESVAIMAGEHPTALHTLMIPNMEDYQSRIRPEREQAYLAVRFDLDTVPAHHMVSGVGTTRRIEALMAVGWAQSELGRRMGVSVQAVAQYRGRGLVTCRTAKAVRALYDELAMIPGPSKRTRAWAAKVGALPPLAWDDDNIDDPTATPQASDSESGVDEVAVLRLLDGHPVQASMDERREAVRRLVAAGHSQAEAAERVGVTDRTVSRWRIAGLLDEVAA